MKKLAPFEITVTYDNKQCWRGAINIIKIARLSNPAFDSIYDGMKEMIEHYNNNQANEKYLFHETTAEGAAGIIEGNFDNRFYKDGAYGYGAYFADDPNNSNNYALANNNGEQTMFICRVILGKEQYMNQPKNGIVAPDKGYDSIIAKGNYTEYIVYRYGQAKP